MLISVAETPGYLRRAERLLAAGARAEIVNLLAGRPKAGDLIRGTGGVRKAALGTPRRRKERRSARDYYYHSESMPLYLLTVFAKNEKADLSPSERAELAKLVAILKAESWRNA